MFSPDGRWLLFRSRATNLLVGPAIQLSADFQLYARDFLLKRTYLVSTNEDGSLTGVGGDNISISADSRVFVYASPDKQIFRNGVAICSDCTDPSVNADGTMIAYQAHDPNGGFRIELVTANWQRWVVAHSSTPSAPLISHDGRYIVFASTAANLVPNDTNGCSDVFVYDVTTGSVMLASVNRFGTGPANGASFKPVLSGDGRTVVFQSFASDLVEGDYNSERDIFLFSLKAPDSDNDGMEDDWELAHFGLLGRDGAADFDADTVSDLGEFLAGTNPADSASALRVLSLATRSAATLLWPSLPGRAYQVQSTSGVGLPWSNFESEVTAAGTVAIKTISVDTNAHRFFRVVLRR